MSPIIVPMIEAILMQFDGETRELVGDAMVDGVEELTQESESEELVGQLRKVLQV